MTDKSHKDDPPSDEPGCRYIYRPWRMVNGKKLYAKTYGLKAWRIPVYD